MNELPTVRLPADLVGEIIETLDIAAVADRFAGYAEIMCTYERQQRGDTL